MTGANINPNTRSPFVDAKGALTKYGMDVILRAYRALQFTGNTSVVETIDSDLTTVQADITDIQAVNVAQASQIADLQDEVALIGNYPLTTVTSNIATTGRGVYNVTTAAVIITLNASPDNGEQVLIHKNTGSNGDYIDVTDGTGTDRIVVDQSVISYRYSSTLAQWVRGL